jgi:hypothetical protein
MLAAVFYYHHAPTNPSSQDCSWPLTTRSEYDSFASMARDSAHFQS